MIRKRSRVFIPSHETPKAEKIASQDDKLLHENAQTRQQRKQIVNSRFFLLPFISHTKDSEVFLLTSLKFTRLSTLQNMLSFFFHLFAPRRHC